MVEEDSTGMRFFKERRLSTEILESFMERNYLGDN